MPQRRSFGSGCSWRDNQLNKSSATDNTTATITTTTTTEDSSNDTHTGRWSTAGPHPNGHKVIDHVPYRSRPGVDWKPSNGGSSWREKQNDDLYDNGGEEEPEWMSFGPSDKYELMELKGLDEHELEREVRREPKTKAKDDEQLSLEEDSLQSTSPFDKDAPKIDLVDSGLPSSCPNEEEDGFILDGFDFKSVLSICQELASDSGDEGEQENRETLYKAKDTYELKNALISVLGISKEEHAKQQQQQQQYCPISQHHPPPPPQPTPLKPQVEKKRALTVGEIEGQSTTSGCHDDTDQSAFKKFLASINNTRAHPSSPPPGKDEPLQKTAKSFMDDYAAHGNFPTLGSDTTMHLSSRSIANEHVPSSPPSTHHQQSGWPSTTASVWEGREMNPPKPPSSSHLFNPSPSSLGLYPHHLRQQHGLTEGGGRSGSGGNTNWVAEMEQLRISELNQMKYQYQQQQQQQQEQRRRMMMHQQQIMSSHSPTIPHKVGSSAPSLGFLPTSVIRHMHNSKPNQSINDISLATPHSRFNDQDYPQTADSYLPPPPQQSHHPLLDSSYGPPSLHQPPYHYHSQYRPNIRGSVGAMDMGKGYPPYPMPHPQAQYMRMGSSPVKPPGLSPY